MVYLFQMGFLLLMILSVVHPVWSTNGAVDNPGLSIVADFIQSNSGPLVRATQIISILSYVLFADASLQDVVRAVETFPRFDQATSTDRIRCMVFSCTLRFTQGCLAICVALMLVISSSNVIDIILNFTAVNFISALDDVAFYLAKWGKYGPKLEEEAKHIEQLNLPRCMFRKKKHVRHQWTVGLFTTILFLIIGLIVYAQENKDMWATQILRVEFQDETGLQKYSGCYGMDEDAIGRREGHMRKVYKGIEENDGSASFGYCIKKRRWLLFEDGNNACNAGDSELANSAKTDSFDISTSFDEAWYSVSGTPLDLYFIELSKELESQCLLFDNGICDPIFNSIEYQFDGGDCCPATCTQSNCGIGALKNAFGTANTTSDGFPQCVDPNMEAITIRLDSISSSRDPAILNISEFMEEDYFDFYGKSYWSEEPITPLLLLECDENIVLSIGIDESMTNNTETVMVNDGASCTLTVRNTTSSNPSLYDEPIWHVNYTIFRGDNTTFEILQVNSGEQKSSSFYRIPVCLFDRLSNYMDIAKIYDDSGHSTQTLKWMSEDNTENSNCQDDFFIERYALSVLNFAAPINPTDAMWINTKRQCMWPAIECNGGSVAYLDLSLLELSGTIATSIGFLPSLISLKLSKYYSTYSIISFVFIFVFVFVFNIFLAHFHFSLK